MAYSNWGARVWRNEVHRHDREDVAVFDESLADVPSGVSILASIARLRARHPEGEPVPKWEHCHHAVLGDGPVRLCGYKSLPRLYVVRDGEVEQIELPDPFPYDENGGKLLPPEHAGTVEIDGRKWVWGFQGGEGPEHIELLLVEPDQTVWGGTSGYCMGAGWDDEPCPCGGEA